MVRFWLCLKDALRTLKLEINFFSQCSQCPSVHSAKTESSKKSQCSNLAFSEYISSLFFSSHSREDKCQHSKVGQNSIAESL